MRLSILLVTTLTVKVINGMSPVPACEDETVCCPELLLGGAAVDCEQYGKNKRECSHIETWLCCTAFYPSKSGIGPAWGCDSAYPNHVMCAATVRKGKRYYNEELASGGKCGASASNLSLGQAVAATYGTNTGDNSDGIGTGVSTNAQTSPGVGTFGSGTGLDTDSTTPDLGVSSNIPSVSNVGGQLPSLDIPARPVAVSQLPAGEAGATKNTFSTMFTTIFSSEKSEGETHSDQISYPYE